MASTSSGIPGGRMAQYAMLVATVPGLERRGSKTPYTSLNGNMSSFLTDTGVLALRLETEARETFMHEHRAELCQRHGRVMREYVAVPEALWKQRTVLRRAFMSSVAYVGTLKPKVSKRKAPAKKAAKPAAKKVAPAAAPVSGKKKASVSKAAAKVAIRKKPAAKKPAAKKPAAKKPAAKKPAAKKPAAKKPAAKKPAAKKPAAKKPAKKPAARRKLATKTVVKARSPAKKASAKRPKKVAKKR